MLTGLQVDVISEMINIGVGRSASILNEMVRARVQLQVPIVRVLAPDHFSHFLEENALYLGHAEQAQGPYYGLVGGRSGEYHTILVASP